MSIFSEKFLELKEDRNLTLKKIADLCGKDRSTVFYWGTGKTSPSSRKNVDELAEVMQLPLYEKKELIRAYEITKYGEENYQCFEKIYELFHALRRSSMEYQNAVKIEHLIQTEISFPKVKKLENRMEILQWLQTALDSMKNKSEKHIYIKLEGLQADILLLLKMFCNKMENLEITMVVYLENTLFGTTANNLHILKELSEFFFQKNSLNIYSKEARNTHGIQENDWFMIGNCVIQYHHDLSEGLLLSQPEWVNFFQKNFQDMLDSAVELVVKSKDVAEYTDIIDLTYPVKIASIENAACLSVGLELEILENLIYPHIPNRQILIDVFMKRVNLRENHTYMINFCPKSGVYSFMETGYFPNVPSDFYAPLPMEYRCRVLRNAITAMEKKQWIFYFMKEDLIFCDDHFQIYKKLNDPPVVIIDLQLENMKYKHVILQHPDINEVVKNYFHYLIEECYVYPYEETLQLLKEILKEYETQI